MRTCGDQQVNIDLLSQTTLDLFCAFRDLEESTDSSSLSSDDDEASTPPTGVTVCQQSGTGWILGLFVGNG